MDVLVYLLADPQPASPEAASDGATRILLGRRGNTEQGDEEHLQLFSSILLHRDQAEVFDALRKSLPFQWQDGHRYDTVNPFGDSRQTQYRSLWTFDTRDDSLHHINRDHRSQIPLSLLRRRVVSMADMEILGGPIPDPSSIKPESDPETSYWKPRPNIDNRLRTFLHQLLRDFDHQWRHILRNHYNFTTLRVFARAIIRLSTLDFEIKENTRGYGSRVSHVWIMQLPPWEPLTTEVESAGKVHIVLCTDIQDGLSSARQHLASQDFSPTKSDNAADDTEAQANYIILSVKHIVLCHITSPTSLTHTAPEPLFNGGRGSGSPSNLALDYLIWATASIRTLVDTPLQSLPVEVQDMVLEYVSIGTVAAAKLGCLLGLGTPFSWRDGSLKVTLEKKHVIRPTGSSVESQIWFAEHKSGIVYLARGCYV